MFQQLFHKKKVDNNIQTVTLQISGMHCISCSMNIDMKLEEMDGMIESNTQYAKALTVITYDIRKLTLKQVKDTIRTLGYDVISAI
jgi:copper chaperone CopZ